MHQPGSPIGHSPLRMPSRRAKRGKVQAAVLTLLAESDMHGYQIIQELAERSGGAWTPSPGSIYPALQSLEESGFVASESSAGRRVFSLTPLGRKHAEMLGPQMPWSEMATQDGATLKLKDSFHGLMAATSQVAQSADPQHIEKTAEILADARRRIYLMLAEH